MHTNSHSICPEAQQLLGQIAAGYQAVLGDNLVGIYVHGSLAFGCFRWEKSDLDFIVVTRSEPALAQKEELLQLLLQLTPAAPPKGFEMSVVLLKDCQHFVHPCPFVLHFSNTHLQTCQQDLTAYCQTMRGTDPDLAAHFTVIRAAGFPLCGAPIDSVFGPVPPADYWDSLWQDTQDAEPNVLIDPVYVILNLCRVLAYAQEGRVLSKEQGGQWGLSHLPAAHVNLIQLALSAYGGADGICFDPEVTRPFVQDLLAQIQTQIKSRR